MMLPADTGNVLMGSKRFEADGTYIARILFSNFFATYVTSSSTKGRSLLHN